MFPDLWYFSRDGEEKMGPTPGFHLRTWLAAGHLDGEHLVWHPSLEDWTPIRDVPTLNEGTSAGPADDAEAGPRGRLVQAALDWIQETFGMQDMTGGKLAKLMTVFLISPLTLLKLVVVPSVASGVAADFAEQYGIELMVGDWDADLIDLKAIAKHAVISVPGPYAKAELLKTEAIEVDLSLTSGLLDGQWIQSIHLKEPQIYVERLIAGHWNWQDMISMPVSPKIPENLPSLRASAMAADHEPDEDTFLLPKLTVEGMDLQWVENLPGNSKGGIIENLKATLYVDDISFSAKNLLGWADWGSQPDSLLSLEARTGSGKISFSGRANLFAWEVSQEDFSGLDWHPFMNGEIYLENVGSNALGKLVPHSLIVPDGGTMTGSIRFETQEDQLVCLAQINLQNARFKTSNQAARFMPQDDDAFNAQLDGLPAEGQYEFDCGGPLDSDAYRAFQAFQTEIVVKGVAKGSNKVRAMAAMAHQRYSQDPVDPELRSEMSELEKKFGRVDSKWDEWNETGSKFAENLKKTKEILNNL